MLITMKVLKSIFSWSVLLARGTLSLRVLILRVYIYLNSILKVDFQKFLTINVAG